MKSAKYYIAWSEWYITPRECLLTSGASRVLSFQEEIITILIKKKNFKKKKIKF